MRDPEVLQAVCCLAGADGDVTVEELQFLDGLARQAGLEQQPFRARIAKTHNDEQYRRLQVELAMRDVEGTMSELIRVARESGSLEEGRASMLLWRVATNQLNMSPDRFQSLLASGNP